MTESQKGPATGDARIAANAVVGRGANVPVIDFIDVVCWSHGHHVFGVDRDLGSLVVGGCWWAVIGSAAAVGDVAAAWSSLRPAVLAEIGGDVLQSLRGSRVVDFVQHARVRRAAAEDGVLDAHEQPKV